MPKFSLAKKHPLSEDPSSNSPTYASRWHCEVLALAEASHLITVMSRHSGTVGYPHTGSGRRQTGDRVLVSELQCLQENPPEAWSFGARKAGLKTVQGILQARWGMDSGKSSTP